MERNLGASKKEQLEISNIEEAGKTEVISRISRRTALNNLSSSAIQLFGGVGQRGDRLQQPWIFPKEIVLSRRKLLITAAAGALGLVIGQEVFPETTKADQGEPKTDVGVWYKIKAGDTLSEIAARFGIPESIIRQVNRITNPNYILTGTQIWIPSGTDLLNSNRIATNQYIYVVRPGDTLTDIATEYGVTIDSLMANNQIRDQNKIYIGQRLQIVGAQGEDIIPNADMIQPIYFPYKNKGFLKWLTERLPRNIDLLIVSGAIDMTALSVSPLAVVTLGVGIGGYVAYNIIASNPDVRKKLGSSVIGIARGLQSINDWFYTKGFAEPALGVHPGAKEWPDPTSTEVDISHLYEGGVIRYLERVRDYGHLWRLNKQPDDCFESDDGRRKLLIWNFGTHKIMFIHNLVAPKLSTIINRDEARSMPRGFQEGKKSEDCEGSLQYVVNYIATMIKKGVFKIGGGGTFIIA